MIFFGTSGKSIPGSAVSGVQCPSCHNHDFSSFGVARYFHLFLMPMFPISRKVGIECGHCKKTLIGKEIEPDLQKSIKTQVYTLKSSWTMFLGLIIFALILAVTPAINQHSHEQNLEYISQPQVNDFYVVNFADLYTEYDSKYKYGLLKIQDVKGDLIEFKVSQNAYKKPSGASKVRSRFEETLATFYDEKTLTLSVEDLSKMIEAKTIVSVYRD